MFGLDLSEFYPKSYRLDILSDLISFINSPNDGLWIKKPYDKKQFKIGII